jgi:hypothetical protein
MVAMRGSDDVFDPTAFKDIGNRYVASQSGETISNLKVMRQNK